MRNSNSRNSQRGAKRVRNHRAEYQARIARGLAVGKSRSAARGHASAADRPKPAGPIDLNSPLERALKLMKQGASQKAAAKAEGVSTEKLRIYRLQNTTSKLQGRTWAIFDLRPQAYRFANKGKLTAVTLARDEGSEVGNYWHAVKKFLKTNNAEHLRPYVGRGVRDVNGRFHQFEAGPNTLRRMESMGELNFIDIYAATTGEV